MFTLTLAVVFLLWLRHSFPGWRDAVWLGKAGGMLVKGSTPPAGKFNGGQKILFWLIVLGGLGMIMTGAALLAPYRTGLVSKTFGAAGLGGFRAADRCRQPDAGAGGALRADCGTARWRSAWSAW